PVLATPALATPATLKLCLGFGRISNSAAETWIFIENYGTRLFSWINVNPHYKSHANEIQHSQWDPCVIKYSNR
ncbi:MAG: hypothetical protein P1U52_08590, partial [Porticoccaceae bacterium]|nr:hypothetical protein [Porticoccaceae bacterium]